MGGKRLFDSWRVVWNVNGNLTLLSESLTRWQNVIHRFLNSRNMTREFRVGVIDECSHNRAHTTASKSRDDDQSVLSPAELLSERRKIKILQARYPRGQKR